MKVLHLTSGNLFGGIESYLLTLARLRHLAPEMEPQFGVCFPGRLRDGLIAADVPVTELGPVRVSRLWTVLQARRRLVAVLRRQSVDAVVTHDIWPHAVFGSAVKRAGVRLVNAVHGVLTGRHWLERWAARTRPDALVANSRFTAGPASALFGRTAAVVHCPVAAPVIDAAATRLAIRRELGTPPGTTVILQASRLEEWKGHRNHVAALGHLAAVPGWQAWFAGGPQKAGEEEYLRELKRASAAFGIADRVLFLGQRSDVRALMAASDIFCQPNSGPEPFGIALVEAFHAGLPVVSSRFGGAAEIVDATCGVLVLPGDVPALAEALRSLLGDSRLRSELGDAGPTRAAELCDPARQMARLAELVSGCSPVLNR